MITEISLTAHALIFTNFKNFKKNQFLFFLRNKSSHYSTFSYQSLYFVPSSAVSCDLVNTSKTLFPSQESEVGSSCIECIPHSGLLVIGSIGIRAEISSFFLARPHHSPAYPNR